MSFFLRNIKDHWKMLRPWRFPWKVRREFLEKCPLIGEHGFNKMADLGPQSFTNGTGPSQDSLRTRQEDNLNAWPQGNPLKPVAIVPPVHPFATPRIPNTRSIANGNRITMRTRYPISSSSSSIASLLPGWPDPAIGCHMARISCKGSFLSTFFLLRCRIFFAAFPETNSNVQTGFLVIFTFDSWSRVRSGFRARRSFQRATLQPFCVPGPLPKGCAKANKIAAFGFIVLGPDLKDKN